MKDEDKLKLIIYIIVLVAIAGAFLGWSADTTNLIMEWLISIFIGILLTMVSASLVEAITGNLLKKILIPIEILGHEFSISLFAIVTFIVKIILFGI